MFLVLFLFIGVHAQTCGPGSYLASSVCTPCTKGKYQPNPESSECLECQSGKYSNQIGAEKCTDCPEGFFSSGTGLDICTECPYGFEQPYVSSIDCTICADNMYKKDTECQNCAAGKYLEPGYRKPTDLRIPAMCSQKCTCSIGEVCIDITGVVKDNVGTVLHPNAHPMRYDANTMIFGGVDESLFKMIKTDLTGIMMETRKISSISTIEQLTVALWNSVASTSRILGKYDEREKTQCIIGGWRDCVENIKIDSSRLCRKEMSSIQGPGYPVGCAGAVWSGTGSAPYAFSRTYCMGEHTTLIDFNEYYRTCCDWTEGACVEKYSDEDFAATDNEALEYSTEYIGDGYCLPDSVSEGNKFLDTTFEHCKKRCAYTIGCNVFASLDVKYGLITSGTCEDAGGVEPVSQAECNLAAVTLGLGDGGGSYGELGYAGNWDGPARPRCTYYATYDQKVRYIRSDEWVGPADSSHRALCRFDKPGFDKPVSEYDIFQKDNHYCRISSSSSNLAPFSSTTKIVSTNEECAKHCFSVFPSATRIFASWRAGHPAADKTCYCHELDQIDHCANEQWHIYTSGSNTAYTYHLLDMRKIKFNISVSQCIINTDSTCLDSADGSNEIPWKRFKMIKNIGLCEGHCESDVDCAGDLVCFHRGFYEDPPGCGSDMKMSLNVCIHPVPRSEVIEYKNLRPAPLNCNSGDYSSWDRVRDICYRPTPNKEWYSYCGGLANDPRFYTVHTGTNRESCALNCANDFLDRKLGKITHDVSELGYDIQATASLSNSGECRCHFLKFTEYCNNEANQVSQAPYVWSILYLRYRSHDRSSDYVQYEGGVYKKRCEPGCQFDADCFGSSLACHIRSGDEPTPGCKGTVASGLNVCYDKNLYQYECPECEIGKYQDIEGAKSCKTCPQGYYQDEEGSNECKGCSSTPPCCSGSAAELPKKCDTKIEPFAHPHHFVQGDGNGCKGASIHGFCTGAGYQGETGYWAVEAYSVSEHKDWYTSCCEWDEQNAECVDKIPNKCEECLVGKYSNGMRCVDCGPTQVSIREENGFITFGKNGSTACYNCSAGFEPREGRCQKCAPGKFSSSAQTCELCPIGKFTPDEGQTQCNDCLPGFYDSAEGSTKCEPCDKNEYVDTSGASSCLSCPAPKKSPLASSQCYDTCPDGTTDNGLSCDHCQVGKYFDGSSCQNCPSGKIKSKEYEVSCTECVASVPNSERDECLPCAAGKAFQSGNGCVDCRPGTFGELIEVGESLLFCRNCPSGYIQPDSAAVDCQKCSAGRFSNTPKNCASCPLGWIAPSDGSIECNICPHGTGESNRLECVSCQGGYGTVDGICEPCPVGKYSDDITGCKECAFGKVASSTGSEICIECEAGQYAKTSSVCDTCDASAQLYPNILGPGSTHCIECSDPTIACQDCEVGKFFFNSVCTSCPDGFVNNGNRQCQECTGLSIPNEDKSECELCPVGFIRVLLECQSCPAGKYQFQDACEECPIGTFQSQSGQNLCDICPSGKTSTLKGLTNADSCKTCNELGVSDATVIIDSVCSQCLAGKIQSSDGLRCETCPPGRHRTFGSTVCEECDIGKFTKDHTACKECPTGFFNTVLGSSVCNSCIVQVGDVLDSCDDCAPGYKKVETPQQTSCEPCSSGKFSLAGETVCQDCFVGQFQPQQASSSCQVCQIGKYQDQLGATSCKNCEKGKFQPATQQGICHECPHGRYESSFGSSQCQECPPGKYTELEGRTDISQCLKCPAGYFELERVCRKCVESTYQDSEGQVDCKSCGPNEMSAEASTSSSACFSLEGMTSYVFGMKPDSKSVQSYNKLCEIRPNSVLLCPACTCDSDSRNGYWDSPICDECQRGFATRNCKVSCAGYNGRDDSTMCNGNGRCWFGKFGNGLCYCGGKSKLDTSSKSAVVDVRLCPKGQICPNYGQFEQEETVYKPIYYMIMYRQYSAFVLQLSQYTPQRGHMWFKRYAPGNAYENSCQECTGAYQQSPQTSTGYWSKDDAYTYFKDELQTKNGFHGENCQYECALCLNGGRCSNTPHPYSYGYTLEDSYRPQISVYLPTTFCVCPSIAMDPQNMCCPNGFQPYVYEGLRDSVPYSRFTAQPLITSIVNERMDRWILRDVLVEPGYQTSYREPADGLQWIPSKNQTGFVQEPFDQVGVFDTHKYYGMAKDICRACPGLFGKGVRSQSALIQSEEEAEDFWWDNAIGASSRKCNGVGVCDFYSKQREIEVHFMGNTESYFSEASNKICSSSGESYNTYTDFEGNIYSILSSKDCAERAKSEGGSHFAFQEAYKGGTESDFDFNTIYQSEFLARQASSSSLGYASFMNYTVQLWVVIGSGDAPIPNSDSRFTVFMNPINNCQVFHSCKQLIDRPGYALYSLRKGRAAIRQDTSTYDRFDTCFTYSFNNTVSVFGLYNTRKYQQGEDPFLGGLCPKGHFCTTYNDIGYKEECPPGYYQPDEGMTRTVTEIQCSIQVNEMSACQSKTTTVSPNDYVDKVCIRCPRSMWSAAGSKECSECPVGRVKKISGEFDTETTMLNFPTPVSQYNMWYYQYNEQGSLEQDCALVPESLVHVPGVNDLMTYERKNFLPVVSCPFGYTTQAGSVAKDQEYIERFIRETVPESTLLPAKAFIEPPFVKERPNFLWNNVNGQTCTDSGMRRIQRYEDCQAAAASFGVYNVQYRLGMFEGCWYIPSVNPNTAYWGVIGIQKCIPSLSYFCMQGTKQEDAWSHFTSQFCRRCPGESVSGPESGSCTTCYENRIKQYSKDSIQMIAEQTITKMKIKGDLAPINPPSIEPPALEFTRRRLSDYIIPPYIDSRYTNDVDAMNRYHQNQDLIASSELQNGELYIDSNVLHEANINLEPIDETESKDLMARITFESQYSSNLDLGDCLLGCLQMYNTDSYGITFDEPQTYPLKNTRSLLSLLSPVYRLTCELGEVCYGVTGVVKNNLGRVLDAEAHPMRYNANRLIFGGIDGVFFKMIMTDLQGVMKKTAYINRNFVSNIESMTIAVWDNYLEGSDTDVDGKKTCISDRYCLEDFRFKNPCPYTHPYLEYNPNWNKYWCYSQPGRGGRVCRMTNSGFAPPAGGAWGSSQDDCVFISPKTLGECQSTCKASEDCDFLLFESTVGLNIGVCKIDGPVESNFEKILDKQCFNAKTTDVQYDKAITGGYPKYYRLNQNYHLQRMYHGCPGGTGGKEVKIGYRSCTSSHTGETSDLAGCESKCHNHDGCEFFVHRDGLCYYKDVECDVAIPYYKEFTGTCFHNLNNGIRIYDGDSDNPGTYREQVERCALGCSDRRGSDSFSSPDKVYGFTILMGRCTCTFVDPADCTRVSTDIYSDYHQFTFRRPFTWNVEASNPPLVMFPVVRAYAYTNDAKNEYPDGTSLCDASSEKRIEECAKACHERPFQYHTSEDTVNHLPLEDKDIYLRFANGFFIDESIGRCYCSYQEASDKLTYHENSKYNAYNFRKWSWMSLYSPSVSSTIIKQKSDVKCGLDAWQRGPGYFEIGEVLNIEACAEQCSLAYYNGDLGTSSSATIQHAANYNPSLDKCVCYKLLMSSKCTGSGLLPIPDYHTSENGKIQFTIETVLKTNSANKRVFGYEGCMMGPGSEWTEISSTSRNDCLENCRANGYVYAGYIYNPVVKCLCSRSSDDSFRYKAKLGIWGTEMNCANLANYGSLLIFNLRRASPLMLRPEVSPENVAVDECWQLCQGKFGDITQSVSINKPKTASESDDHWGCACVNSDICQEKIYVTDYGVMKILPIEDNPQTTVGKLGLCEGDCDVNTCLPGYTCQQRNYGEEMSECQVIKNVDPSHDYCVKDGSMHSLYKLKHELGNSPEPLVVNRDLNALEAIGLSDDFKTCACSLTKTSDDRTNTEKWSWYSTGGYFSDNSWEKSMPLCSNCEPGEFLRQDTCQSCPKGYYTSTSQEANRDVCVGCQSGTYQDKGGQSSCNLCPAGFSSLFDAQTSCTACQAGYYQDKFGLSACKQCPSGFRQPDVGKMECYTCPAGKKGKLSSLTNRFECEDCQPGQYQNVAGSASCKPCPIGKSSNQTGRADICDQCEKGKYQSQTGAAICLGCAVGKYNDELGTAIPCTNCPSGYYQDEQQQHYCSVCQGGRTCSQVSHGTLCQDGAFVPEKTWASTCSLCDAETTSNGQFTACRACPSGRTTKGKRGSDCLECPEEGWNGILSWDGLEFQTQDWSVQRVASKPGYDSYSSSVCSRSCTKDSDCESGDACFDRGEGYNDGELVPGCWKSSNNKPKYLENRCYKRYSVLKTYVFKGTEGSVSGLGECEGECEDNSDCQPGLQCHKRNDLYGRTPGCEGSYYGMSEDGTPPNVCYDPSGEHLMSEGYKYVSYSPGYPSSYTYLPEGAYPPLLDEKRRLYNSDRIHECMNRCRDAYGSLSFFIRVADQRCGCGPNDWTKDGTPYIGNTNAKYFTYSIFPDDRPVKIYDTYVVALSDGPRQYTFYDPDDYAKMETWQQGVSRGIYEPTPYTTTVIEQHWSKGMNGRFKISCGNDDGFHNCHFKISNQTQYPGLKFYKSDPGSNYCALN